MPTEVDRSSPCFPVIFGGAVAARAPVTAARSLRERGAARGGSATVLERACGRSSSPRPAAPARRSWSPATPRMCGSRPTGRAALSSLPLRGAVATAPRLGRGRRAAGEPGHAAGRVQAPVRRLDRPERLRRLQGPAARMEGRRLHRAGRHALGGAGVAADAAELRRRADGDRRPGNCGSRTGQAPSRSSRSGPTGRTAASTTSTAG